MLKRNHRLTASAKELSDERILLTAYIMVTMVFIADNLRDTLVNDSKLKTHELAVTINSNLHHLMILRAPKAIQATLENIVDENESVIQATILISQGSVTFSSDPSLIGRTYDRYEDTSCRVCHTRSGEEPDFDVVGMSQER